MAIIKIDSLSTPGIEMFVSMTEAQLRNRLDRENSIFIAESPKVIKVALQAGYKPVALLCEERHIAGDAADIIAATPDMDVFTGSRGIANPTDRLHPYSWSFVCHETPRVAFGRKGLRKCPTCRCH